LEVLIFNFALDPTRDLIPLIVPAILWISLAFGGIVALTRSINIEKESGALTGISISPIGKDAFFFGKVLSTTFFILIVEFIISLVLIIFYNVNINVFLLLGLSIPAIFGFSLVGTLFAVISVNSRAQEVLLPILFLPMVVPVILSAVEITFNVILDKPLIETYRWMGLLFVFDAIYVVIGSFCFNLILNE